MIARELISMSMTSQDQGKKSCHTAPDSLMSGEMGKIWTLHSILCGEIQKWEAFSATPPVRLGVGQDDQKMPKNVKELPPSCKLT